MIRGQKIRLYPTNEQEKLLWQYVGAYRWSYNRYLSLKLTAYRLTGQSITPYQFSKYMTKFKKRPKYQWLNDVPANTVKTQPARDVERAFQNFYEGRGEFPKFKSKKKSKPSFYTRPEKLKIENG
ncbi:MAG: helix-turn-helix domain-containing protein, partial [Streptococcaceae bacterium]|nr:helix-turn-helix domain-containing protein [Streptococcaceae bacterium]